MARRDARRSARSHRAARGDPRLDPGDRGSSLSVTTRRPRCTRAGSWLPPRTWGREATSSGSTGDVDQAAVRRTLEALSADDAVGRGHPPAAASARPPAWRHHRRARPGEGPRRHPPAQRGPHLAPGRWLRAVVRRGGPSDPAPVRDRPRRPARGRHRPQQRRGSSGTAAAHRGGRHGHHLSPPHARSRCADPKRRDRHRGRRVARARPRARPCDPVRSSSTAASTSSRMVG